MTAELTWLNKIQETCGAYIEKSYLAPDLPVIIVRRNGLVPLCTFLKEDPALRFNFLSDICGVDHLPAKPRFEVVYHLYSIPFRYRLRLKCPVGEEETVPTVTGVWSTANWHEREAYDMYGIVFADHPDLRRIYMWEGYDGYPLRKDYPTKGYKDEYNPFGAEPDAPESPGIPKH